MKSGFNISRVFFAAAALVAAVASAPTSQAIAQTTAAPPPSAALTGPCEVRALNWRGRAFYEVLFMNRVPGGPAGSGNYFNSIGSPLEAPSEVTDARFRELNAEALRRE